MLFSVAACASPTPTPKPSELPKATETSVVPTPSPTSQPKTDEDLEIERAIKLGLVPDEIQTDFSKTITFSQYSKMLTNLIAIWDDSRLAEWETICAAAAASNDKMDREDGIVEISYAVVMMGADKFNHQFDEKFNISDEEIHEMYNHVSSSYPYFPDWRKGVYEGLGNADYLHGGVYLVQEKVSQVSRKAIYPYDFESHSMHFEEPLTRQEAILAVLRLAESDPAILEPPGQYVSIYDVGIYDKTVITDELLNQQTDLPLPTQSKLPSTWRGAGISARKDGNPDFALIDFKESDIQLLADNGMNITRLFLDLSTLQFPDYPEDKTQVNMRELEDLDQVIAWGIKYQVHILVVSGSVFLQTDLSQLTQNDWQVYADYWAMLARRYAGIPGNYLSFEILSESKPEGDMTGAIAGVKLLRDSIWAQDPDRVVLVSHKGNIEIENMKWVEAVAEAGLAMGIHPYYPNLLTTVEWHYAEKNPLVGQPQWPVVWFPGGKIAEGRALIIIRGEISGGQLQLACESYTPNSTLVVFVDGKYLETIKPNGGEQNGNLYECTGEPAATIQIPEGAKEIKIQSNMGRMDTVVYTGSAGTIHMNMHDAADYLDFSDPLPLIINADGTYTNSENKYLTAESVFEKKIGPMIEIAQKNNVGYMISEWASFVVSLPYDIDLIAAFTDDMLAMFEEHDLSWIFAETEGWPYRFLTSPTGEYQWKDAQLEKVTYTYEDGHKETFYVNRDLMDVLRKHTMPE